MRKPEDVIINEKPLDEILRAHYQWLHDNQKLSYDEEKYFEDTGLKGEQAVLHYADLSFVNLQECNLRYANLSVTNLSGSNLQYAVLEHATMPSTYLVGTDLTDAYLRYVNLLSSECMSANFTRAELTHANMKFGDFQNANFEGANLEYADISDAAFEGANLLSITVEYNSLLRIQSRNVHIDEKLATRTLVQLMRLVEASGLSELKKDLFTPELTARYEAVLQEEADDEEEE